MTIWISDPIKHSIFYQHEREGVLQYCPCLFVGLFFSKHNSLVCHFHLILELKSSVTQMGTQHNGGFGGFTGCLLITVIFFSPYWKNCKYDCLRNCISKQKCVLSRFFHILRHRIKTHSQAWLISSVLSRTETGFYVSYWFWVLYRQWNVGEVIWNM